MDEFEQFLKQQPLREVPPTWRKEVLLASTEPAPRQPWWQEWLWPSPFAWAGLACVWLIILALNVAARPTVAERQMAKRSQVPSQEIALALTQQRKELAQLLAYPVDSPAEIKQPSARGPRSEICAAIREA